MNHQVGIFGEWGGALPPEILIELQAAHHEFGNVQHQHAHGVQQPHHLAGNFVLWERDRCKLPPLSVSVRARVVQDTAQVTVIQRFWNNSDHVIPKSSYTIPLTAGCTVTSFICRIGNDKVVKAKIKPKQEARDAFHRAMRDHQTTGLLEQKTPEIFTTTLGNIPKKTKIRAEITFVTLLDYQFADHTGCTKLTIPANMAPNCGIPRDALEAALPSGLTNQLAITVEVASAEKVPELSSKTHQISVERRLATVEVEIFETLNAVPEANEAQVALVTMDDLTNFLDKDFTLEIFTEPDGGDELPQAWLEHHPTLQNHRAIMLTLPPKFFLKNRLADAAGEIVFVADRSGSMSTKIESLKSALFFFLKSIPQHRQFNLWCFGSDYSYLWPQSRPNAIEETLDQALYHVKGFEADMGCTNLFPVLKAVIGARAQNRTTDIIVLTDGHVHDMQDTMEYVQEQRVSTQGSVRFFALGIGRGVSHELVEGIAKAGGGYAEIISDANHGGWEDRVVAVLQAAVHGHVPPPRFEVKGVTESPAKGEYNGQRKTLPEYSLLYIGY